MHAKLTSSRPNAHRLDDVPAVVDQVSLRGDCGLRKVGRPRRELEHDRFAVRRGGRRAEAHDTSTVVQYRAAPRDELDSRSAITAVARASRTSATASWSVASPTATRAAPRSMHAANSGKKIARLPTSETTVAPRWTPASSSAARNAEKSASRSSNVLTSPPGSMVTAMARRRSRHTRRNPSAMRLVTATARMAEIDDDCKPRRRSPSSSAADAARRGSRGSRAGLVGSRPPESSAATIGTFKGTSPATRSCRRSC